jgi:hypothetical protein
MFDWKNLKEGWIAVLKKRECNKRLFIILLIISFEIEISINVGQSNFSYLFFRRQLGWTEIEFSRLDPLLTLSRGITGKVLALKIENNNFEKLLKIMKFNILYIYKNVL